MKEQHSENLPTDAGDDVNNQTKLEKLCHGQEETRAVVRMREYK